MHIMHSHCSPFLPSLVCLPLVNSPSPYRTFAHIYVLLCGGSLRTACVTLGLELYINAYGLISG